ncbi:hypothetical protein H0H93_007546 [Arthromyces matolae]|nr:hypothetical protein H0H93_007546 [Arthromyces matolae]
MLRQSKRPRIPNDGGHTDEPPDSVATPSVLVTEIDSLVNDANGPSPVKPRLKRMTVRGKRGKLESIAQFPLDVVFELDPLDVLNLSRTSKALRSILMRRSSQFIWKSALAHIEGLPECPSDMSEPAYTNLVFSSYCNSCAKARVGRPQHVYVHKDTLQQYLAEKRRLKGTALHQWLDSKDSQYRARKQHAGRCEKWNQSRNLQRTNELADLRDQRYQSIKEKLCELGWEEEIAYIEFDEALAEDSDDKPFSEHKLVKQPKALTERSYDAQDCTVWHNIKDTLIQFMVDFKADRLDDLQADTDRELGRILSKAIRVYAATQPLHAILPPTADVASEPSFAAIIENTPLVDELLSELHFQSAMEDFPRIVEEWRCAKDEMLVKMINDHPGTKEKATLATLQRATTFFRCNSCGRPISYPRILVHNCSLAWNYKSETIEYDSVASGRATRMLQECQLDPALTIDALNQLDLRFECRNHYCVRVIMKLPVVRAVLTPEEKHSVDMEELSEKLLAFKPRKLQTQSSLRQRGPPQLICRECKDKLTWEKSYDHLIRQHADIIPAGYTNEDHENSPERFMALSLDEDAHLHEPPVKLFKDEDDDDDDDF